MLIRFIKAFSDPLVWPLLLGSLALWLAHASRKWERPPLGARRAFWLSLAALLLPSLLGIRPVANMLAWTLERDSLQSARPAKLKLDTIVVLGGGGRRIGPLGEYVLSEAGMARTLEGVRLFRMSGAKRLVFSGGGVMEVPEGTLMANQAREWGIPSSSIVVESQSGTTRENAREIARILGSEAGRTALVTSAYHMPRSLGELRHVFPGIIPVPADFLYDDRPLEPRDFVPSSWILYRSGAAIHEWIGRLWYVLGG